MTSSFLQDPRVKLVTIFAGLVTEVDSYEDNYWQALQMNDK